MKLHTLLANAYGGWLGDVPAAWQGVLQGVAPDFAGVPKAASIGSTIPLFPRLKSAPHPLSPPGAGVLRAIERVRFDDVRVVVMGQDPYPSPREATGRGFEPGDWVSWGAGGNAEVPRSFKRIVQRLVQHRTGNAAYAASDAAWTKVKNDEASGGITLRSPKELYDGWEDQGAIFLNKVLTYTLPAHVGPYHGVLWRPIVSRVLHALATRKTGNVVFALWGAQGKAFFQSEGVQAAAVAAGTWNKRVKVVTASHPAAHSGPGGKPGFLAGSNPFKRIADAQKAVGASGASVISW